MLENLEPKTEEEPPFGPPPGMDEEENEEENGEETGENGVVEEEESEEDVFASRQVSLCALTFVSRTSKSSWNHRHAPLTSGEHIYLARFTRTSPHSILDNRMPQDGHFSPVLPLKRVNVNRFLQFPSLCSHFSSSSLPTYYGIHSS